MNRRALFGLLLVIIVVLGAAVALYYEQHLTGRSGTPTPLAPKLAKHINEVQKLSIMQGEAGTTLMRQDDGSWVVQQRGDYPADFGKVKHFLLTLSESQKTEQKTSKPEQLKQLGLDNASAKRSRIYGKAPAQTAEGKTPEAPLFMDVWLGNYLPERSSTYIRLEGENASWLASGKLDTSAKPAAWLDNSLVNIDRSRIRRVTIKHPDGKVIEVSKAASDVRDFMLQNIPAGREKLSDYAVNNMAYVMERAELVDAQPEGYITFTPDATIRSVVQSFDGIESDILLTQMDGQWWASFNVDYNPDLVEPKEEDNAKAAPTAPTDDPAQTPSETDEATQQVLDQVNELQRRTTGWVFALPEAKATLLVSNWDSLTKAANAE